MFSGGRYGSLCMMRLLSNTNMTIGIPDLGQVADIWQHMDLLQGVEQAIFLLLVTDLRDRTILIINVTENNGVGRTGLLTSSLDVPLTISTGFKRTIFLLGL